LTLATIATQDLKGEEKPNSYIAGPNQFPLVRQPDTSQIKRLLPPFFAKSAKSARETFF